MLIDLTNHGWAEALQEAERSGYKRLPAGAYVCKIFAARLLEIKDKGLRLDLDVDVVEGTFAGYFKKLSEKFGEWPSTAVFSRYLWKEDGKATKQIADLVKILEKQNPNFKFDPAKFSEVIFVNLTCGFTFEEEFYTDRETGETKIKVKVKFPCDAEKVRRGEIKIAGADKSDKDTDAILNSDQNKPADETIDDDDVPF